jgi:hypothetical protein
MGLCRKLFVRFAVQKDLHRFSSLHFLTEDGPGCCYYSSDRYSQYPAASSNKVLVHPSVRQIAPMRGSQLLPLAREETHEFDIH